MFFKESKKLKMVEEELVSIEVSNFAKYVQDRKALLKLPNRAFSELTKVSVGEISKIITKNRQGVSLHSFYRIVIYSGDTIENACKLIYPHRSFRLKKVKSDIPKKSSRNKFGLYMQENFETDRVEPVSSKNSFEIIQQKTGIEVSRLKDIYFNTGAPEPYEFLLIEKAVGMKPGEMMKDYIEKHPVTKKTK